MSIGRSRDSVRLDELARSETPVLLEIILENISRRTRLNHFNYS